jgi:hypothetical protein
LKEDNLQLRNHKDLWYQNRTTVVKWLRKFGNFDWENQTPFTMSKSEQKIMELEAKVKLLEKQKSFLNDRPLLQIKKQSFFFDMIDISQKKNIKLTYEKLSTNRPF